jgi:hypothetical protein
MLDALIARSLFTLLQIVLREERGRVRAKQDDNQ